MITLPSVFSSGALFQAAASLRITGTAAPHALVSAAIVNKNDRAVSYAHRNADDDGGFSLELFAPDASFDPYSILITDDEDEILLEDILFGELWLASGQSNMELPNAFVPGAEELYDAVAGTKVRVYHVSYDVPENRFPWDPKRDQPGQWIGADDRAGLQNVSAMGLKFVRALYRTLSEKNDVPVGFLNASWGGTPITAWFPRDAVEADPAMTETCRRTGNLPEKETWNTRGDTNFQQPTAQYNLKIAPLEGVTVRGVIWYQGENECGGEYWQKAYADYLRFYHKTYAGRFAADPEKFFMICSLIYPWTYGPSGECNLGYLNDAFVTVARESPDKFGIIPISHLEPDWAYHMNNHPIHPTNKYDVGEYAAQLALANVYGAGGQKAPAILKSWEAAGERIRLIFSDNARFLRVGNTPFERARGLYVAGENGIYLPAEYEITGHNTMEVWCDEIPDPVHAAYNVQSMEPKVNLFAGDYPVAPFFTDRTSYLNIEARPWYDCGAASRWASKMHDDVLDLFFRPVFEPLPGSAVCSDTAFRREDRVSLRIEGEGPRFGCLVRSYPYQRLDFEKFAGLSVHLFNTDGMEASLALVTAEGEIEIPFERADELGAGWGLYEALFPELSGEITRMEFRFRRDAVNFRFVNMEHPRLFF